MRRKLNISLLRNNLWEAAEELRDLLERLEQNPKLAEAEIKISFEHAFHHLSFAWNGRHATPKQYGEHGHLSDENFNRWSKLPRDLRSYSVPVKKRRPKSKSKSKRITKRTG
jgi:hypothetical protein